MSKMDEIRALREGRFKSSRGRQIAAVAEPATQRATVLRPQASAPSVVANAPREAKQSSGAARTATRRKPKLPPPGASAAAPVPVKRKFVRPRLEDRDKTLAVQQPWVAAKMSRRTWFRRQAEKRVKQ